MNRDVLTTPLPLEYVQSGSGTPLLLLHGFPFDHTIWREQVAALSDISRVITPDLRGHGRSPAPTGAYSMDLMAQDVLLTLDDMGVEKAIWVGHSMGGYVTLAAWRLAPERFLGFGLVASNHRADSPEARDRRLSLAGQVEAVGSEAAVNPKVFAEGSTPEERHVEATRQMTLNAQPEGIIGTLLAMAARPDSTDTLATINVPALIIGGAGDQLFKPEIPQQMAERIPGAKLVMVADAGHVPMLEQPQIVNDALRDLVKRVNAR
jgi:pimeloyl-ACP methyl ester carboxylesterase